MAEPSWTDSDRWRGLVDGSACPFCLDGPRGIIADLTSVHVTMDQGVNVRGYCCLILKEHAVEMHALSEAGAFNLMKDIQRAARAVQNITGAIKLNYEVHGNVIPHIHIHIVPRYPGDAIELTGLPFAKLVESPYRANEFEILRDKIREALKE